LPLIDFPAELAKLAHAIQKLGDLCCFAMRAAKKNVDRSLGRNSFLPVQFRRVRAKLVEQLVDQLAGECFPFSSFIIAVVLPPSGTARVTFESVN
jgi:hypothetical protein